MHRAQEQVRQFHKEILEGPTSPADPKFRNALLRARLILEEAGETVAALVGTTAARELMRDAAYKLPLHAEPDFLHAIDGVCDTIVVCYGTAEDMGIDLEPFFDEVMKANMAKAGGPVRADGKKLKPAGWLPPDIAGVLAQVKREREVGELLNNCLVVEATKEPMDREQAISFVFGNLKIDKPDITREQVEAAYEKLLGERK